MDTTPSRAFVVDPDRAKPLRLRVPLLATSAAISLGAAGGLYSADLMVSGTAALLLAFGCLAALWWWRV